jgi:excisionase family DNA binding protein
MTELLRVVRAAKLLDVTRKRIYNLIDEGKLEAVKLGPRQTRIVRESLEAYIARLRKRRRIERGLEEECGRE